jgi:tetratricopeptide (TPR) repeat protein
MQTKQNQKSDEWSREAKIVLSLIETAQGKINNLSAIYLTSKEQETGVLKQAEAVLNGDLRIAQQQAAKLSDEEEGKMCRSMAFNIEARIYGNFFSRRSGLRGEFALREGIRKGEESIALYDIPEHHSILGLLYADRGKWDKARAAYTRLAETDIAELSLEAEKELLRVAKAEGLAKNPLYATITFLQKYWRGTLHGIAFLFFLYLPMKEGDTKISFWHLLAFSQFLMSLSSFYKVRFKKISSL